jgi:hypothetical protein
MGWTSRRSEKPALSAGRVELMVMAGAGGTGEAGGASRWTGVLVAAVLCLVLAQRVSDVLREPLAGPGHGHRPRRWRRSAETGCMTSNNTPRRLRLPALGPARP